MKTSLAGSIYAPPRAERPWRLEDFFPGSELRFFSFGRRALAEGLRAAGLGEGSKVLLPEFICLDLLSSLAALRAAPEFYPVRADLSPASAPADWPKAAAVLAVDYFGFPQDLSPFKEYSARTGAVVVEDNAHGLFSRDKDGKLLGTRADLGLFSARKTLALPNGAFLVFKKGDPRWRIPPQRPFRESWSLRRRMKGGLRSMAGLLGGPAFFAVLSTLRTLRRAFKGSRTPAPDPGSEERLPLPEGACAALAAPLRVADGAQELLRRRLLYLHFEGRLRRGGFLPVFPSLPEGVVPYAFPFRAPPGDEARCLRLLAGEFVEPLPWPDLPVRFSSTAPEHYRDVRAVHFLW